MPNSFITIKDSANTDVRIDTRTTTDATVEHQQVLVLTNNLVQVVTTPTLTVAGTYQDADYVGPSTTPGSIAGVASLNAGTGTLMQATIVDKARQQVSLELWLFDATLAVPLDNGAWSISDADALNCVGIVPINAWYASALNAVGLPSGFAGLDYKCAAAATSLFYALVVRSAATWATGDLQLRTVWRLD